MFSNSSRHIDTVDDGALRAAHCKLIAAAHYAITADTSQVVIIRVAAAHDTSSCAIQCGASMSAIVGFDRRYSLRACSPFACMHVFSDRGDKDDAGIG